MRLALIAAALVLSAPAFGQQLSPLTGTTAAPPALGTPPAVGGRSAQPAAPATPRRGRRRMQDRFDAANTTHDGRLTLEQARAARMTRVVRNFDAIDTGRKGYVTMDDLRAYGRAQRAARRARAQ